MEQPWVLGLLSKAHAISCSCRTEAEVLSLPGLSIQAVSQYQVLKRIEDVAEDLVSMCSSTSFWKTLKAVRA